MSDNILDKKLTIVVGTNSLTEVQYPAYTNHCQFWFRLGRTYPNIRFIFSNPPRMSIDRMRNMTAKAALECQADYVLFLDDDVIVNPNYALKHLLECEADIAAGKVCVRGWPFDYMVFNKKEDDLEGLYIKSELPKTGIHPCDAVGFSFCLIKVDVIRKMPEPWFVTGLNNTEDIYFCKRARQIDSKCKIVVNCDCECGHILWPEVITETNRESYKQYMRSINPQLVAFEDSNKNQSDAIKKQNPVGDRGVEYLEMVIKAVGGA